jgi:transcription antitermination factor NusG
MLKAIQMTGSKRWYAVYTKPRWEKKVHTLFEAKGMESYCPLNKVHRKWSDRIKLVEEPLFKSYVFIHVPKEMHPEVRLTSGVLNFVYWLGKPAIVKQSEIDRIKRFLNEYDNVTVEPLQIMENDQVVIRAGAFMDQQAKVVRAFGKRVEVEIQSLGYKLVAILEKRNVQKVKKG